MESSMVSAWSPKITSTKKSLFWFGLGLLSCSSWALFNSWLNCSLWAVQHSVWKPSAFEWVPTVDPTFKASLRLDATLETGLFCTKSPRIQTNISSMNWWSIWHRCMPSTSVETPIATIHIGPNWTKRYPSNMMTILKWNLWIIQCDNCISLYYNSWMYSWSRNTPPRTFNANNWKSQHDWPLCVFMNLNRTLIFHRKYKNVIFLFSLYPVYCC